MTKLFTRASVAGATLTGANLKATLVAVYDALRTLGVTDANRTTVTASATLLTSQTGYLPVSCAAGNVTLTLPASGTDTDEAEFRIRRTDSTYANVLNIARGGTDTIEGSATGITIGCGQEITLKLPAGAADWRVISRGGSTAQAEREAANTPMFNWLHNPDGAVYQRAVSATADDVYMDDRWYALTQTGTITPSQLSSPEDGFRHGTRLTQSQAVAQRFGAAQIIEGKDAAQLRGKVATFGMRARLSTAANLRMAILAWTGTEDVVTSDAVNDWTSGTYTGGNFFVAANFTVVAVSQVAMAAATTRDAVVTGAIPSGTNNILVLYWTEAVAAQNVTLDAWGRRLVEAASMVDYERRAYGQELALCQRYYYQRGGAGLTSYAGTGAFRGTTSSAEVSFFHPVPMRAAPTISAAAAAFNIYSTAGAPTSNAFTVTQSTVNDGWILVGSSVAVATQGTGAMLVTVSGQTMTVSAEL